MAGPFVSWELGAEDYESWRGLVEAWGGYAARLFDYHDFGFPARDFLGHVSEVSADLVSLRQQSRSAEARLWPREPAARRRLAADVRPWNPAKSLGYLAGAGFLVQPFRARLTHADMRAAYLAKTCYQCIQDILDDFVDHGDYTYPAALELYEDALSSMGDRGFDLEDIRGRLLELAPADAGAAAERLVEAIGGLRTLLANAPNPDMVEEFHRLNDWIVIGQSLSALQKSAHRDLETLRQTASTLWSPEPDLSWQERYGGHISWPLQESLLDMAFAGESLSRRSLDAHRDAWYYFHAVLANLNHLLAVRSDLQDGIVNVALLSLRERELFEGREPETVADLTLADHEAFFDRTAELTRRGLDRAADAYEDPRHFNASIAILVGVVAMASKIGRDDEMIHAYMRWLAPVVREAVRGP